MPRVQSSNVAVLLKRKKRPTVIVHLKPKMTLEVCEGVPEQDWRDFSEFAHVAISIGGRRILDGDNDYSALEERCNQLKGEEYFIAPGDRELAESALQRD